MEEELNNFMGLYEQAANSRDFNNVAPLISEDSLFWFTNGTYRGVAAIRLAFEETWSNIKDEKYTISNIEWLVMNEKVAVCSYDFKSDGLVSGKRQVYEGQGTNVMIKNETWKMAHEHLSKSPES